MDLERWWLFFLYWYRFLTPLGKYWAMRKLITKGRNPIAGRAMREFLKG